MAAQAAPLPRPLQSWAKWMQAAGNSQKTIDTRTSAIRSLLTHAGRTDPVSITTMELVEWLADCRSRWTRTTYSKSARAWHRWLVEQGLRDDDPTARLPAVKQPRGMPRPAPTQAIDAVLEDAPRRARAYIELAAYEGLRVHEIAKVRGEDFEDGWLFVQGKGDEPDAVPIHQAIEQLRRGYPERGYWFPSRDGTGHVRPNSVSRTISQTFRRAGYDVTAHQLRHWFGTHALRVAKDVRVAQELLRHASLQSTQMYTKVSDQRKTETVRRLTLAFRSR